MIVTLSYIAHSRLKVTFVISGNDLDSFTARYLPHTILTIAFWQLLHAREH